MKLGGRWRSVPIALLVSAVVATLRFSGCSFVDLIDARAIDFRFVQRGVQPATDQVAIVAVDDRSIEELGRWPWPRPLQARLVDAIAAGEPSVIGFDIVQSEPTADLDREAILGSVADLGEASRLALERALEKQVAPDRALVEALRRSGRSILGYYLSFEEQAEGQPTEAALDTYALVRHQGTGHARQIPVALRAVPNLDSFRDQALGQSYFNVIPDSEDGMLRRFPMVIRLGDQFTVPLALSLARAHLGNPPSILASEDYGVSEVRLGDIVIPTAEDGKMMLNYRGPGRTFEHISAVDLLHGRVPASVLRDRMVLVGVTAKGVEDIRVTPFDGVFPGVELHATAIDNIIRGDFVWQPVWLRVLEVAMILVGGVAVGIVLAILRGWGGTAVAFALMLLYLVVSQWIFVERGYALSVLYPLLGMGTVFGVVNIQNYLNEERERRRTRRMLELYLSPSMAEFVSERPDRLNLGGDKRRMTVLFSDVREFTRMSEGMGPEELVELLNLYLGEMTDAVFATSGMLDKYVGDAVMAVWGAPLPNQDHASLALRAASDMLMRLDRFNREASQRGWPVLRIGVGINTGEMVFGNMGSKHHMALTVMGDEVNLASRLEGLAPIYGAAIIVSETTLREGGAAVSARELDRVRVKGREQPTRIFEVFLADTIDADYLELYAGGLAAYKQAQWRTAGELFSQALGKRPGDAAASLFVDRCRDLEASGSQEIDRVTEFTVK